MKEIQKRMIAVLLCVVLVAGLLPTTAAATAAKSGMENFKKSTSANIYYNDIPSESWYFDDVQKACTLDFMRGYSKQRFAPDADITIAEALAIAARIHSICSIFGWKYMDYVAAGQHYDRAAGSDSAD